MGKSMDSQNQAAIARDEVLEALRRVFADPAFARSPQLRRLLDYLVQHALDGDQSLKEYTIAVDALGRPTSFDPEHDASVRVQAGRLRRALNRYYAANGRDDPVRIVLPFGSYVTGCERQRPACVESPPSMPRWWRSRTLVLAVTAVLALGGLFVPILRTVWGERSEPLRLASLPPTASDGLPTILIRPFEGSGADIDVPVMTTLPQRLAAAFARFETINAVHITRPQSGEAVAARDVDVTHEIEGERVYALSTVVTQRQENLRLLFYLTDQSSGTVAWTQEFEIPPDSDADAQQERIVRQLAKALVHPFGVIASRERAHQLRTGTGDPRYRCLLEAREAMRDALNVAYASARACLEKTIERDPHHAIAHAYLAMILNRIHQFGWPPEPGILDRALALAHRAVQADPASAEAHFALFVTRFNMGDFAAADRAMAQAHALNDDDLVMRSIYGGRLITRGRIDDGMAILQEVESEFPARSCMHGLYFFLGHYLRGQMSSARRRVQELTCPTHPYALVAKALLAVDAGELDEARAVLASIPALLPGWAVDPRATLMRSFPDSAIVDKVLRDLATAGPAAGDSN
jgi:tetratricopeptide (TPR) repeat protein